MNKNKIIQLKAISKEFNGEQVLSEISIDIHDNEFVTLLGPSGCGKTTMLRIIAGFETADSGDKTRCAAYGRSMGGRLQQNCLRQALPVLRRRHFGQRDELSLPHRHYQFPSG